MVHDRYPITDPVRGLVRSYGRKAAAFDRAKGHPCEEGQVHGVQVNHRKLKFICFGCGQEYRNFRDFLDCVEERLGEES